MKRTHEGLAPQDFSYYVGHLKQQLELFEHHAPVNSMERKLLALQCLQGATSAAALAVQAYSRELRQYAESAARTTVVPRA